MATVTAPRAPRAPRPSVTRHPQPQPVAEIDLAGSGPVDQIDDRTPDDRTPDDGPAVDGPDGRSAVRTAVAVGISLGLLVGVMVLAAMGMGEVVRAGAEWFMTR